MNIKFHIKSLIIALVYFNMGNVFAQKVDGYLKDKNEEPITGATLSLNNKYYTISNINGFFEFNNVTDLENELIVTMLGYEKQILKVFPNNNYNITLKESAAQLEQVVVNADTKADRIKQQAFEVDVIAVKEYKKYNKNLNQVLKSSPGINIRESGGLGSNFNLSLNGLSGNQIRYFLDEVPMESFGSSLSLNNFQVNLVRRIEIYKGVVPLNLGADALGGAINIVTPNKNKSLLDISYSLGSFNTHKTSLFGNYYNKKKEYFVRTMSFYNHSDNDYKMYNVPVFDLELGNDLGGIDTKRFNDDYTSWLANVELGVLDKKFADELSLSLSSSANRKNYQHPNNILTNVFGKFHTRDKINLANTFYKKKLDKLKIKAFLSLGKKTTSVIDTSSYKYNWAGEFIKRKDNELNGELADRKSLFELEDVFVNSNFSTDYSFNRKHKIIFSRTDNYLTRTGEDKVDDFNKSFETPNNIKKSVTGFSYDFKSKRKKWQAILFIKQFHFSGKIITQDPENNDIITKPTFLKYGYGTGVKYQINIALRTKFSIESTYRIPEMNEILGDGVYVNPSPLLLPEQSLNLNFGLNFNESLGKYKINADSNLFSRVSKDFIRYNPSGPFGSFENLRNVNSKGIEASLGVNYNQIILASTNITYQNITDQSPFDEGLVNTNYKSRVPNTPYLFGNINFGYNYKKQFQFFWNTRYVREFFLTWETLGASENKFIIPTQWIHDLETSYTLKKGYSISISANNILNSLAYDNFRIQKPGRSFSIKIRYSTL